MSACSKAIHAGAFILTATLLSSGSSCAQNTPSIPPTEQLAKARLTYTVIEAEGGYGYDVFADDKRLIHQPSIPGKPGVMAFKKKSDAEKVAQLVIRKIKAREMPPVITEEELMKLKVVSDI
jgi:hypothetical protein